MNFLVKSSSKPLKVHVLKNGRPLCGGGHLARLTTHWQQDTGPSNCGACLAISAKRKLKEARDARNQNPEPPHPALSPPNVGLASGEGEQKKEAA